MEDRRFESDRRPLALAVVGGQSKTNPDHNGWGIVAIVPEETSRDSLTTIKGRASRADHSIADPRFLDLFGVYQLETTAQIDRPHEADVSALAKKLDTALAVEEEGAIAKGELEHVTMILAEREALEAREYPPVEPTTLERLQQLRAIWDSEIEKLEESRQLDRVRLQRELGEKLDTLVRTLTRERKIEEALKVKEFRDNLEAP